MPRFLAVAAGPLAAAIVVAWSGDATAHGGIPRAYDIHFEPDEPSKIWLRSDSWGFFRTDDSGATWRWTCAEVYGDLSTDTQRRAMVVLPGGSLLVASFNGLRKSSPDGCAWKTIESIPAGEVVTDIVVDPGGDTHWAVTTGQSITRFWKSVDHGETFELTGPALEHFPAVTLLIDPTNADRFLLSGHDNEDQTNITGEVHESTDGATTWERRSVLPLPYGTWDFRLVAIDPRDPERVFAWEDTAEKAGQPAQPDALWVSSDGAKTWERYYQGAGDLSGFAFSPDGARLAFAGPEDGLWIADAADLANPKKIVDQGVWGLAWMPDGRLYAGWAQYPGRGKLAASFAVSYDEGASFEPVMDLCTVKQLTCPEDSMYGRACPARWTEPRGFVEDFQKHCTAEPAGDAGPVDVDSGKPAEALRASGGCSAARAAGAATSAPWYSGVGVAAWALLGRRRRDSGSRHAGLVRRRR